MIVDHAIADDRVIDDFFIINDDVFAKKVNHVHYDYFAFILLTIVVTLEFEAPKFVLKCFFKTPTGYIVHLNFCIQ